MWVWHFNTYRNFLRLVVQTFFISNFENLKKWIPFAKNSHTTKYAHKPSKMKNKRLPYPQMNLVCKVTRYLKDYAFFLSKIDIMLFYIEFLIKPLLLWITW